jgi:hypothetical protein
VKITVRQVGAGGGDKDGPTLRLSTVNGSIRLRKLS